MELSVIEQNLILKAQENLKNNPELKTKATFKDIVLGIIPAARAFLIGKKISREQQIQRLVVCSECDLVSYDGEKPLCGVCGCALHGSAALILLTTYEEDEWHGCKASGGSRWKKAGC